MSDKRSMKSSRGLGHDKSKRAPRPKTVARTKSGQHLHNRPSSSPPPLPRGVFCLINCKFNSSRAMRCPDCDVMGRTGRRRCTCGDGQREVSSHRRIQIYGPDAEDDVDGDGGGYGIINWQFRDIFTSCRAAFTR